ncbi:hypothetical protein MPSI1_001241 [Malassezia psittaci]|uniref:Uncharacterized protein n=1 Tax=Malassezia psittaci TaxID=1821823 RepID=A0AAF0F504_9BASI|nr:hypothetical protein MPSI1_001241 [Malassezia psittaci]
MTKPAIDSPLFRRDVLKRIAKDTLDAPSFPHEQLDEVLSADHDPNAPIPPLDTRQRLAVEEASKVLAMYRSTDSTDSSDLDKLYTLRLEYTQAGCSILLFDLAGAQRTLELLTRELRPRPQSSLSSTVEAMHLDMEVLGTLQWLSKAQNQTANAERYSKWRAGVQAMLPK